MADKTTELGAVEKMVDALMEDSGLPRFGPHRKTIERRQRLALASLTPADHLARLPREQLQAMRGALEQLDRWSATDLEASEALDAALHDKAEAERG